LYWKVELKLEPPRRRGFGNGFKRLSKEAQIALLPPRDRLC
jgi:hypothetical protein